MGYAARKLTFDEMTTDTGVASSACARMRDVAAEIALATTRVAANDTLYGELENRYGGGFAQWVVDWVARTEG